MACCFFCAALLPGVRHHTLSRRADVQPFPRLLQRASTVRAALTDGEESTEARNATLTLSELQPKGSFDKRVTLKVAAAAQSPEAMSTLDNVLATALSIGATVAYLVALLLNSDVAQGTSYQGGDSLVELFRTMDLGMIPDDQVLLLPVVMAVSAFAQAFTGFGFAIVSVGVLAGVPWLVDSPTLYPLVTPLVAALGAVVGTVLLLPNVRRLQWAEITPLLIPCTVLTPAGVWLATIAPPEVATRCLAVLILGFVAYSLANMARTAAGATALLVGESGQTAECDASGECPLPEEDEEDEEDEADEKAEASEAPARPSSIPQTAAYSLGAAAGVFGGAWDIQGPPLVVYGNLRGWSTTDFRDNILTVVALNSLLVVATAQVDGRLHSAYFAFGALVSLPGVLVGTWAGQQAAVRVDPALFKQIVLLMCLGLGIKLAVGARATRHHRAPMGYRSGSGALAMCAGLAIQLTVSRSARLYFAAVHPLLCTHCTVRCIRCTAGQLVLYT